LGRGRADPARLIVRIGYAAEQGQGQPKDSRKPEQGMFRGDSQGGHR